MFFEGRNRALFGEKAPNGGVNSFLLFSCNLLGSEAYLTTGKLEANALNYLQRTSFYENFFTWEHSHDARAIHCKIRA